MRYLYRLSFALLLACLYFTAHAQSDFDPSTAAAINLDDLPVLPQITDTAREIYARGQIAGRDSHAVAKVGDCMTASENFLVPFSTSGYNLGAHTDLQPVIDYFAPTFARSATTTGSADAPALATTTGFTTVSVQDSIWADPAYCPANESPLACEYRVSNAAFALIMFGTNDTTFFDPESFNNYLRQIIDQTIAADIVPVLSTFPERPEFPDKSILFNQIVAQIAQEYDLPLVNLYRSLEDLPDKGINLAEPIHLSSPIDNNAGNFTPENLERGYTLRNLVTLQALDVLYKGLVLGEDMATPEATVSS